MLLELDKEDFLRRPDYSLQSRPAKKNNADGHDYQLPTVKPEVCRPQTESPNGGEKNKKSFDHGFSLLAEIVNYKSEKLNWSARHHWLVTMPSLETLPPSLLISEMVSASILFLLSPPMERS